jgi:hypothetical protein
MMTPYTFLKRGNLPDSTLLSIMFSGDMPTMLRGAAEEIMLERGWLDSLIIEVAPPHRTFYRGLP